jgi:hypothetical protein
MCSAIEFYCRDFFLLVIYNQVYPLVNQLLQILPSLPKNRTSSQRYIILVGAL